MKKVKDSLFYHIKEYFTIFLPKQARRSPHTILSTQQVWSMLLPFISSITNKRVVDITFADFSRKNVMKFLDEMQKTKGWTPATRNHRLARIRSFFRYVSSIEPTFAFYLEGLKGIPLQKGVNKSFTLEYMSKDATATFLRQPDTSKKTGIRDQFFLVLMYDSAARDCEMLSMQFGDLDPIGKVVCLLGKGNKPRSVPICDETVQHFHKYSKIFHPDKNESIPMFYTIRHGRKGPMSDDNVGRFVNQYGVLAKAECSEVPDKVTPHLIRKSRSMALYQAGMPLELLAQWLGHNDPSTTLIYSRADTEMKRKAIESVETMTGSVSYGTEEATWVDDEEVIKLLLGI